MSLYNSFKYAVKAGVRGMNYGLPMGFPRLERIINGIQRKRYDLVFAAEGVGKSAFVMNSYVINPYNYIQDRNLDIDFHVRWYSLEVDSTSILSKMLSWKLYNDESILCSPNVVLSRNPSRKASRYVEQRVEDLEPYFLDMFNRVKIIDKPMTPEDIRKDVMSFAKSRGKFYTDSDGILRYIPDNPREYVVIITDTLGNLKLQQYGNRTDKKGTIDIHSSNSRDVYRNMLGYSVVNVAHSNRSIAGMDRARYGEIFPTKDDVKYTSQPANDANLVMTLFNPKDYLNSNNSLSDFMEYKITSMDDRFRALGILKNRDGPSNKRVGLLFIGECGHFKEIKRGSEMTSDDYQNIRELTISSLAIRSNDRNN